MLQSSGPKKKDWDGDHFEVAEQEFILTDWLFMFPCKSGPLCTDANLYWWVRPWHLEDQDKAAATNTWLQPLIPSVKAFLEIA